MKINKNVRENWRKYIILCLITLTLADLSVKLFTVSWIYTLILALASTFTGIYTLLTFAEEN